MPDFTVARFDYVVSRCSGIPENELSARAVYRLFCRSARLAGSAREHGVGRYTFHDGKHHRGIESSHAIVGRNLLLADWLSTKMVPQNKRGIPAVRVLHRHHGAIVNSRSYTDRSYWFDKYNPHDSGSPEYFTWRESVGLQFARNHFDIPF